MTGRDFGMTSIGFDKGSKFIPTDSFIAPLATPFIMVEDKSNKYKIDQRLKQSVCIKNAIPFLRTNDDDY